MCLSSVLGKDRDYRKCIDWSMMGFFGGLGGFFENNMVSGSSHTKGSCVAVEAGPRGVSCLDSEVFHSRPDKGPSNTGVQDEGIDVWRLMDAVKPEWRSRMSG